MKRHEALLSLGILFLLYAKSQQGLSALVGIVIAFCYLARAAWSLRNEP